MTEMPQPTPSSAAVNHDLSLPPSRFRGHRRTLALAAALTLLPVLGGAAAAPPAISEEWVLLVVKVDSRQGERQMDYTTKVPVRYGTEYRVVALDKTPHQVLVSVLPRRSAGGEVSIETRLSRGQPGVKLAETRLQTVPGTIARMNVSPANPQEKLSLLVMPITPPAGFDPAKERLSLTTPWP